MHLQDRSCLHTKSFLDVKSTETEVCVLTVATLVNNSVNVFL